MAVVGALLMIAVAMTRVDLPFLADDQGSVLLSYFLGLPIDFTSQKEQESSQLQQW